VTETLTALEGGHVPDPAPGARPEHRWWILAVLATAQLMVALDATVVSIALPDAQASLQFSSADRQWIVTAYALAFGSLLLLGGRLADIWCHR
jgi:MFS family permease